MRPLKNFCITLIASTLLIVGPVFGCCSGMVKLDQSNKLGSPIEHTTSSSIAPAHHTSSDAELMETPCHETGTYSVNIVSSDSNATLDNSSDISENFSVNFIADKGLSHCEDCTLDDISDACATMPSEDNPVLLTEFSSGEPEFEPLYFLTLLGFPKEVPIRTVPQRSSKDWPSLTTTPITLHQILTI